MLEHLRTRDDELFRQLAAACGHLVTATRLLERLLAAPPSEGERLLTDIRGEDEEAHELTHQADLGAFRAFVMRVDRMELHEMATALDGAVEAVDKAARMAAALRAGDAPASLRMVAASVTGTAVALEHGVASVARSHAGIGDMLSSIERFRDEAAAHTETGVRRLFEGATPPIEVLRWKEMYERLEHALACCLTAARALEQVSGSNA